MSLGSLTISSRGHSEQSSMRAEVAVEVLMVTGAFRASKAGWNEVEETVALPPTSPRRCRSSVFCTFSFALLCYAEGV